jgi:hypothetical protein
VTAKVMPHVVAAHDSAVSVDPVALSNLPVVCGPNSRSFASIRGSNSGLLFFRLSSAKASRILTPNDAMRH